MKSKILIDLDIVTVALWKGEKKEVASDFLNYSKLSFNIFVPSAILSTLFVWRYRKLGRKIFDFYSDNSEILSQKKVKSLFRSLRVDYDRLILKLKEADVKEEDTFLVAVSSAFSLDLITFNHKHLIDKSENINKILLEAGLKKIIIKEPR